MWAVRMSSNPKVEAWSSRAAADRAEVRRNILKPAQVAVFAAGCGLAVANIYYAQPLIGLIAPSLGMRSGFAGLIVSLTQLGFGAGLLFLVPLSDVVENRRLVL